MKHVLLCSLSVVVVLGCREDRSFTSGGGDDDDNDDVPEGCDVISGAVATGLDITDVALYQSLRVPLLEGGQQVGGDGFAPIIAGRDAMLRVHVQRQAAWESRQVYARVDFEGGAADVCPLEEQFEVSADSTIESLGSTLNVRIPGNIIQPGVGYAVSLREADDDGHGGDSANSVWPAAGSAPFDARDAGGPLKIVIVPVRYNADGSGRLPELGEAQIQLYEDLFYATYPVPGVDIVEVLNPMDWNQPTGAWSQGWSNLLNAVTQLRSQNGAAPDEYYFGLFSPANSFAEFCGSGCVAGLCNLVEQPSMSYGRACIGLGFAGPQAAETMIHEVGHAHGRLHSPSGGAQQVDPAYPYPGGFIGVYGYDLFTDSLKAPNQFYDFMGYSSPTWVSDYTYEALFDRIVAVNAMADLILPPGFQEWWPTVAIGIDGTVSAGPTLRLHAPPAGREIDVAFIDAGGKTVGSATGYYMRYDHIDAGLVLYPEPVPGTAAVRLPGSEAIGI
jgi:hypothetical protein